MPHNFTHMWNLRNKTNEQMKKKRERQRETNQKLKIVLLTTENKLMVTRGEVGERWVK